MSECYRCGTEKGTVAAVTLSYSHQQGDADYRILCGHCVREVAQFVEDSPEVDHAE